MYWYELLFLWTQCYVILTVLNVCTSIGWILFSHSYLHVTHDKISVCLAIWLIWWTNISVIKMINTPGHVLSPGWPLCKRSGLTLIEVSQHAYSSYQASSLPFIFYHVILATWCNWLDFYWCWIKFWVWVWVWVVIGIVVHSNIIVDEEYIIYKYVKHKGAKYWPLWNTFFNVQPVAFCVIYFHPLMATTEVTTQEFTSR